MSFLLLATGYVADDGHIAAILPRGCLSNAKDVPAWGHLRREFSVSVIGAYPKGTFPGTAATTVVVRMSRSQTLDSTQPVPRQEPVGDGGRCRMRVQIVRGCCPTHRPGTPSQDVPLAHYTDLRNGRVEVNGRRGFGAYRCVVGPAVLLPRVGRITVDKIAVLQDGQRVMLSDCVIALRPESYDAMCELRARLTEDFDKLSAQYVGTGAPFITLHRLQNALAALEVQVD